MRRKIAWITRLFNAARALPVFVFAICVAPQKSDANLFVASLDGTIGVYTDSGTPINPTLITGLDSPVGIAVSGNFLYVTSRDAGTIGKYTTTGQTVNAALISGLTTPIGIAVSGNNLFVTNLGNGLPGFIGEYTTSGAVIDRSLITGLSVPTGIAVDGANLFITDNERGFVSQFTTSGASVAAPLILVPNAQGIAVSEGELFVTSIFPPGVGEYNLDGSPLNPALITSVESPYGIAITGGNLFVTNTFDGAVGEYTLSGSVVNASLISGLNLPIALAAGSNATTVPDAFSTIWLALPVIGIFLSARLNRKAV